MVYKALFLLLVLTVSKVRSGSWAMFSNNYWCYRSRQGCSWSPASGHRYTLLPQWLHHHGLWDWRTHQHHLHYQQPSIVATWKGNHISMVITKQEGYLDGFKYASTFWLRIQNANPDYHFSSPCVNELPHLHHAYGNKRISYCNFGMYFLIAFCNNGAITYQCVIVFVSTNSMVCCAVLFLVMRGLMLNKKLIGACILAHIAAIMHYSYKLKTTN